MRFWTTRELVLFAASIGLVAPAGAALWRTWNGNGPSLGQLAQTMMLQFIGALIGLAIVLGLRFLFSPPPRDAEAESGGNDGRASRPGVGR